MVLYGEAASLELMKVSVHISLLRFCGFTQAQIGQQLNLSQQSISHQLKRLRERSERDGPMKIFLEGVQEIQESKDLIGGKNDFYYEGEGLEVKSSQGFPIIFREKMIKNYLNISRQNEEAALLLAKKQIDLAQKHADQIREIKEKFNRIAEEIKLLKEGVNI